MHHALNKLSSPCSELLAGERVIRSDAIRDLKIPRGIEIGLANSAHRFCYIYASRRPDACAQITTHACAHKS